MVLNHVAQRADGVVEFAAVFDAEVLGHRDLHLGDAPAIPQIGKRQVSESQVLKANDRFLAEEVVDTQDLVLAQDRVQPGVQVAGRAQVVAERLLDGNPAVAQELGLAEVFDDGSEQRRRHLKVIQRPPAAADLDSELAINQVVRNVAGQVVNPPGEAVEHGVIDFLAGAHDGLAGHLH